MFVFIVCLLIFCVWLFVLVCCVFLCVFDFSCSSFPFACLHPPFCRQMCVVFQGYTCNTFQNSTPHDPPFCFCWGVVLGNNILSKSRERTSKNVGKLLLKTKTTMFQENLSKPTNTRQPNYAVPTINQTL